MRKLQNTNGPLGQSDLGHQESEAHHDAEGEEHHRRIGPVLRREILEALDRAVPGVGEDQRPEMRDGDFVVGGLCLHVRPAEEDQRRATFRLVVALHHGDFHRLMVQRVQTVHVARENLRRRHDDGHPHGHREHEAGSTVGAVAQQVVGSNSANDEGRRQVSGKHHVYEAVGKGRVEDDRPPVGGNKLALVIDRIAGGRLRRRAHRSPGDADRREDRQCVEGLV